MFGIIIFALILSFLVLIHELGHFFVARWAKVKVLEFGLGYPPKARKLFTWKGTDFTLNWIPFGGFVRLAGEDLTPDQKLELEDDQKQKGLFYKAGIPQKLLIILAGATVNFIFGFIAFTLVFSVMGIPEPNNTARIASVIEDSPAAAAGLPEKYEIVRLTVGEDTENISTSEEAVAAIAKHRGQTADIFLVGPCEGFRCEENYRSYQVYLRTETETPKDSGSLGVAFDPVAFVKYPWWQMPFKSSWYGLQQALFLGREILFALGKLGKDIGGGHAPQDLAGPVGIVHQAQTVGLMSQGWLMILNFAGLLSVNLAIMNVLPLPPLDGGRAVIILLEKVFDKRRLAKLEYYLNYGGYILLIGLIAMVTIQDIARIIK